MSPVSLSVSAPRIQRAALGIALMFCATLAVLGAPHVAARTRIAVAPASVAVAYHLAVLLTQGPGLPGVPDGELDGQVGGTLDSAGMLTATLIATNGATATVTGSLSDTLMGATLTVRGAAGALTLSGHGAGRGGYGGSVEQAGLSSVGSWLLTPEPVAHTYAFVGRVARGGHHGLDLGGVLSIAATGEPDGRFDGTLTLDDGAMLVAEGRLAYGNMQVLLHVPGEGVVLGVVAPARAYTLAGDPFTLFSGTFTGPTAGDSGAWKAGQTG